MTSDLTDRITFEVDISKMIELLAGQIYPSPLALLRENIQNSFDAILLRLHAGDVFEPEIAVTLEPGKITVTDNGVGMSPSELKNNFWKAGSSSKNTAEAQAAGVVGTFGIGAMANFGIARALCVETESRTTGERTRSWTEKERLSVTEECIDVEKLDPLGKPGTIIVADIEAETPVDVGSALNYIREFVRYLKFRVTVNGEVVSQEDLGAAVARFPQSWKVTGQGHAIGNGVVADYELEIAGTGEVRIDLSNMVLDGAALDGRVILRENVGNIMTYRNAFGLASAGISSRYNLGGVADFLFLKPTAGREALTTQSIQSLQRILSPLDEFISTTLAKRPEANQNANFVAWVNSHRRFELCDNLRARMEPGDSATLAELKALSEITPLLVYAGNDSAMMKLGSEDKPLILLSRQSPRRDCELNYLQQFCKIEQLKNEPTVLSLLDEKRYSMAESALAFRLSSIITNHYFVSAEIKFGEISHGLPLLVVGTEKPIKITIQRSNSSIDMLLRVYDQEYGAFDHMSQDYVRNVIFPKISNLVPSATREGADAFLKIIQRNREVFEYEYDDLESLTKVWQDYLEGKISQPEAASRAGTVAKRSFQFIDSGAAGSVRDVVPDVIENEQAIDSDIANFEARPPIERSDIDTGRKLLTIAADEPPLRGYRCFLALTDRIRSERGDFFLQPHRTSIVWGGQKALFIFEHHSGEFGLYYDIQSKFPVGTASGGGNVETCTIVMKNAIFIPVPEQVANCFIPNAGERKRLDVRCELLYIDR
jgi:molecular chaperone HtpG